MPRQLPWKTGSAAKAPPERRRTIESLAAHSPSSSSRAQTPGGADRSGTWPLANPRLSRGTPSSKPRLSLTSKQARSPSTSPPPEPPTEGFMVEGLDDDDRYRMVEDEFLSVAGSFTKHLHAAEYHRLKLLASTRNAEMIQAISRPVTGAQMTDLVKRRQRVANLASRQRRGLRATKRARASESDDEPSWVGTSLQGLMDSPRKSAVRLATVAGAVANTRAAAVSQDDSPRTEQPPSRRSSAFARRNTLFNKDEQTDSDVDENEDDLGASFPSPKVAFRHNSGENSSPFCSSRPRLVGRVADPHQQSVAAFADDRDSRVALSTTRATSDEQSVDPAGTDDGDDFLNRIRDRRAEQRRKRESLPMPKDSKTKTSRKSLDYIPLF